MRLVIVAGKVPFFIARWTLWRVMPSFLVASLMVYFFAMLALYRQASKKAKLFYRLKRRYAGIELRRERTPIDAALWILVQENRQIDLAAKLSAKRLDLVISTAARRLKLSHDLIKFI